MRLPLRLPSKHRCRQPVLQDRVEKRLDSCFRGGSIVGFAAWEHELSKRGYGADGKNLQWIGPWT